jgi:GNAT superfamily N-acetyltransferase
MSLTISVEPDVTNDVWSQVDAILETANDTAGFARNAKRFLAVLRDADGGIQGGVKAEAFWGWVYIAELAVAAQWRGLGFGQRLLLLAEEWAAETCGCKSSWLMTMSFQSCGFYERSGYSVFAELPNYPHQQSRYFLKKALVARPAPAA